jgi:hypothetical protein
MHDDLPNMMSAKNRNSKYVHKVRRNDIARIRFVGTNTPNDFHGGKVGSNASDGMHGANALERQGLVGTVACPKNGTLRKPLQLQPE